MATYTELFDLASDSTLRNRIAVAVAVKAEALIGGATPTTDELTWAQRVLKAPLEVAKELMPYVLAANKSFTTTQIQNATDNAIQTNVNTAADALIAGGIV